MLRVLYKDVTGCSAGLVKDAIAMFSSSRWIARQRNLEWWRRRGLRPVINTAVKWKAVIRSDRFQYLAKDHCRTQSRVLRENDASVREWMISLANVEAARMTAKFCFRFPDWIIDESFDRMFSIIAQSRRRSCLAKNRYLLEDDRMEGVSLATHHLLLE